MGNRIRILSAALPASLALAGCATRVAVAPPIAPPPVAQSQAYTTQGLEGVIGRGARALIAQFGTPEVDFTDGPARKLQFLGAACTLDAYLYPPRAGGDPIVTHVDARLPDGGDMDRSSCVAALSRRGQAR